MYMLEEDPTPPSSTKGNGKTEKIVSFGDLKRGNFFSRSLRDGMIMLHSFDSTSRDVLADSTRYNNDITQIVSGDPLSLPAIGNYQASFDISKRQYLATNPSTSFSSLTDEVTIGCWFCDVPFAGVDKTVYNQGLVVGEGVGLYIGKAVNEIGRRVFGFVQADFLNHGISSFDFPVVDDQWHFAGFSYKSGARRIVWYDEQIHARTDLITGNVTPPRSGMRIGVINPFVGNNGNYFNGTVSLPVVWNKSLTIEEISEFYESTRGLFAGH